MSRNYVDFTKQRGFMQGLGNSVVGLFNRYPLPSARILGEYPKIYFRIVDASILGLSTKCVMFLNREGSPVALPNLSPAKIREIGQVLKSKGKGYVEMSPNCTINGALRVPKAPKIFNLQYLLKNKQAVLLSDFEEALLYCQ